MASSRRRTDLPPPPGLEPVVILVLGAAALLCALPALVIGLLAERLLRVRTWSSPLWLLLSVVGVGLTAFLLLHGLNQGIALQLRTLGQEVHVHQANMLQWEYARLWATTWPVWLETVGLAPVIAALRTLASHLHSGGAASLLDQERQRQRTVARAQRHAMRRLRRPHHLPDAVDGQMVIGIPIDDEANR